MYYAIAAINVAAISNYYVSLKLLFSKIAANINELAVAIVHALFL